MAQGRLSAVRAQPAMTCIRLAALLLVLAATLPANAANDSASAPALEVELRVAADRPGPVIDRHLFGQFAEHLGHGIYEGIWVGTDSRIPNTHGYRNDVLAALKELQIPVIRWPGGCFADQYHWRNGIGPAQQRPVTVNNTWGGVEESNRFGTHEFFELSEMLGADAYLSADVGSGSPQEMADWLEYLSSDSHSTLAGLRRSNGREHPWRVAYLGVGNESWGCGGNMRPEYYADLYRRFAAYIPAPADRSMQKVASGANADDYNWTSVLMTQAAPLMDAISMHYYTVPSGNWEHKGAASGFDAAQWLDTLRGATHIDELIRKHTEIMDRHDPAKRIALAVDEWGVWHDAEPGTNPAFLYQQNSLCDALAAALTLNIFQRHADRVRIANIAQMVNVLQAMIATDGPRMFRTPTYDVFHMYIPFQDATALPASIGSPEYRRGEQAIAAVDAVAARGADGKVYLALVNADPHRGAHVRITFSGMTSHGASGEVLTADAIDAHNTFADPDRVRRRAISIEWPVNAPALELPAKSVTVVALRP